MSEKSLFVAWQSRESRTIYPVARIGQSPVDGRFWFAYVKGALEAIADGFKKFTRLSDLRRRYESDSLFTFLANRLMSEGRPDYYEYLERLDLEPPVDPLVVLARSEGRKPTDNIELFGMPCFHRSSRLWEYRFFVRGVRHVPGAEERARSLHPGDRLHIEPDPENASDSRAHRLIRGIDGGRLGFVPKTLLSDLEAQLSLGCNIECGVVRVNHHPAPVHQRILARFLVDHREGFIPFSADEYQPLPADDTASSPAPDTACR